MLKQTKESIARRGSEMEAKGKDSNISKKILKRRERINAQKIKEIEDDRMRVYSGKSKTSEFININNIKEIKIIGASDHD